MDAAWFDALADSVTAGAAVAVIYLWRRPPAGQSDHDLVRRIAIVNVRLRQAALAAGRLHREKEPPGQLHTPTGEAALEQLLRSAKELRDLLVEVEAVFEPAVSNLINATADETQLMAKFLNPRGAAEKDWIPDFLWAWSRMGEDDPECIAIEARIVKLCNLIKAWSLHFLARRQRRLPADRLACFFDEIMGETLRQREAADLADREAAREKWREQQEVVKRISARDRAQEMAVEARGSEIPTYTRDATSAKSAGEVDASGDSASAGPSKPGGTE